MKQIIITFGFILGLNPAFAQTAEYVKGSSQQCVYSDEAKTHMCCAHSDALSLYKNNSELGQTCSLRGGTLVAFDSKKTTFVGDFGENCSFEINGKKISGYKFQCSVKLDLSNTEACIRPFMITQPGLTGQSTNAADVISKFPQTQTPTEVDQMVRMFREANPNSEIGNKALTAALNYWIQNKDKFRNKNVISVADFDLPSWKPRLAVIDMKSFKAKTYRVAHGKGSDENHDGFADSFSNSDGTHKSSLGAYRIDHTGSGAKYPDNLVLNGLESTNSNAEARAVIMHPARYVTPLSQSQHGPIGRSFGCPAVSEAEYPEIKRRVNNGSMLYIYSSKQSSPNAKRRRTQ